MSINPKYIQENPPNGPATEEGQTLPDKYCLTALRRIETFLGIVEPLMDRRRFKSSLRTDIDVGFAPVPETGGYRFFSTNLATSDLGGGFSFEYEPGANKSALYRFRYVNTRTKRECQLILIKDHPNGKIWAYSPKPSAWTDYNNEIEVMYLLDGDKGKVVTHDGNRYHISVSPNMTWDRIGNMSREIKDYKKLFLYLSGIFNRKVIIPYYQEHHLDIRGNRLEQPKLQEILHRLGEKLGV